MILERFFDYWNFNKLSSLPAATLYENHNKLIITFRYNANKIAPR